MSDKEIAVYEIATLYKLRLMFSGSEKNEYTREEILDLLDKIAMTKKI